VDDTELRLIHTTVETPRQARRLARELVEAKLAACVSVEETPVTSFYRWEGRLEEAKEHGLRIKTRRARVEEAVQLLRRRHPYDCPEILVTPVEIADPDYAAWVSRETRDEEDG